MGIIKLSSNIKMNYMKSPGYGMAIGMMLLKEDIRKYNEKHTTSKRIYEEQIYKKSLFREVIEFKEYEMFEDIVKPFLKEITEEKDHYKLERNEIFVNDHIFKMSGENCKNEIKQLKIKTGKIDISYEYKDAKIVIETETENTIIIDLWKGEIIYTNPYDIYDYWIVGIELKDRIEEIEKMNRKFQMRMDESDEEYLYDSDDIEEEEIIYIETYKTRNEKEKLYISMPKKIDYSIDQIKSIETKFPKEILMEIKPYL